jgi:hypothetical protein
VPAALVAVAEQPYSVPLVKLPTTIGDPVFEACFSQACHGKFRRGI